MSETITLPIPISQTTVVNTLENAVNEQIINGIGGTLYLEVDNDTTGGAALTVFSLEVKAHPDTVAFDPIIVAWNAGNDFDLFSDIALQSTGNNVIGICHCEIPPCYSFRIQANCGTSTTVDIRGYFSKGAQR